MRVLLNCPQHTNYTYTAAAPLALNYITNAVLLVQVLVLFQNGQTNVLYISREINGYVYIIVFIALQCLILKSF